MHSSDNLQKHHIENIQREELQHKIDEEAESFGVLVRSENGEVINQTKDNATFWNENASKFPNLYKLALILLGIPSSSAGIERFFSLCGFMSKKQSAAIDHDLFVKKCLLRGNLDVIHLLNEIKY